MSIVADKTESWVEQHSSTTLLGNDLPWLNDARQQALSHFEQIGLPSIRDEKWRYTNLRTLKSNAYKLSQVSEAALSEELQAQLNKANDPCLVFIDGHLSEQYSQLGALSNLEQGVVFTNLATALNSHTDTIKSHLGKSIDDDQHGFTALNTTFCQDGYVLLLANNATTDVTLEVIFISTQTTQQSEYSVAHTRNLIIAGTNTKCAIVERHIGVDGSVYLNNTVTEIIAADNAHIDHYKIQQESVDAFHVGGVFIQQAANSNVSNHNIALNGLVIRNDVNVTLNGQGAHSEMNGLVIGTGRQHVDNHTQVHHAVPNCTSDEYYKSILDDHSRSVFRGRIIVAQDAQQTNADQQNNNLLLSEHAEADTKPQLEIYADDVKCSHGATVGQLDATSLFYLRSRGIDKKSAIDLLTVAFANEVIDRIQIDAVRDELVSLLTGQLLASE